MASIEKVTTSECEFCLSDFWMKIDGGDIGPCWGFALKANGEKYRASVYDVLKSLDASGRGDALMDIARYEQQRSYELLAGILLKQKVAISLEQLGGTDREVACVRYTTANSSGPQDIIGFEWNDFEKMDRPRFIKGVSRVVTTFSGIPRISEEYLRLIR